MNKQQLHNLHFLERQLLLYFTSSARKLPWRKPTITPYEVWVSEIMLQQTQVARVIEYCKRFLKKFPTVKKLAQTTWEEFLPYYAGLGYYARGRNMLRTAQIVSTQYRGMFPKTSRELMQLPGIGPYTAAAILSFGYNQDALAFDTNMKKVFGRYMAGSKSASVKQESLERALKAPKRTLNAAIMDFANDICVTRPKCAVCPLARRCVYQKTKGKREPTSRVKSSFPTKNANVLLWLHRNHREYYSLNLDAFEPFQLPAATNTRETIKAHFQEKYGLTLAVRPPHQKVFIEGQPTLFVNAQILLGEQDFGSYSREDAEEFHKNNLEQL